MFGAWAAGELASRRSKTSRRARRITARAGRPAVKDGLAALQAGARSHVACGCGHDDRGIHNGRLVHRARPGLRHDHAAGRQCGRGRCGVGMALSAMRGCCRGGGRGDNRGFWRWSFLWSYGGFWGGCSFRRGGLDFSGGRRSGHRGRWLLSGSNGRRGGRLDGCHWLRCCALLLFLYGRSYRRLDDNGRWRRGHNDDRTRNDCSACRSLGDHRTGGRAGGDGRRSGRSDNDRRRGTRLGNNPARFRAGGLRRCRGCHWSSRRGVGCRLDRRHGYRRPHRRMALAGFLLFLLLGGQNGFQHVAGLGDMREVNFGRNDLRSTRGRGAPLAC
jgi:hypothetical protein